MVDIGYESHNALQNLGTVALFVFLYFIRILMYIFVFLISKKTGKWKAYKKYLQKKLFYNELITIFIEAYIEFLISGCLTLTYEQKVTKSGDIFSKYLGMTTIFVAVIILPLVLVYLILRINSKRDFKKIKISNLGAFFEDIKKQNKW